MIERLGGKWIYFSKFLETEDVKVLIALAGDKEA